MRQSLKAQCTAFFRACLYPNGSCSLCVCIEHSEWGSCNSETEFSIWIDFSLNWRSHMLLVFSMSDSAVEDGDSPGVYFRGEWVSWICQSWVVTCAGDRGAQKSATQPSKNKSRKWGISLQNWSGASVFASSLYVLKKANGNDHPDHLCIVFLILNYS